VPLPPADVEVDAGLVATLLRTQHPDLAELPLQLEATGWDNVTFRLGRDLAVRLPRIAGGAELLRREQEWLPRLGPRLPLSVPVPVRRGVAGAGYPWPWSVVPWLPGRTAAEERVAPDQAPVLGSFLAALHCPPPPDAPRNSWRGIPLSAVTDVETRLAALEGAVPGGRRARTELARLWQLARATPRDVPEALVHADLHPRNVVVDGGRLAAVLDWGDLTLGDPATDLAAAWMLLPTQVHPDVWTAYGQVSAATLDRARGWAVYFATALLETGLAGPAAGPGAVDDPMAAAGQATFARLTGLHDDSVTPTS
jgi:aminoglycoside phosphotransferase (APT) family kinase protein